MALFYSAYIFIQHTFKKYFKGEHFASCPPDSIILIRMIRAKNKTKLQYRARSDKCYVRYIKEVAQDWRLWKFTSSFWDWRRHHGEHILEKGHWLIGEILLPNQTWVCLPRAKQS